MKIVFLKIYIVTNSAKLVEKSKGGKAGNEVNKGDNKKVHYLEPLASHILNDIITSLVNATFPSTSSDIISENTCENNNMERRLASIGSIVS